MTIEEFKNIAESVSALTTVIGFLVGGIVAYRFYFMQSVVMSTSTKHVVNHGRVQLLVALNIHNVGNTHIEGRKASITAQPLSNGRELSPVTLEKKLGDYDPTHLYLIDKGEFTCLSFVIDLPEPRAEPIYGWRITSKYTSQQLLDNQGHYLTWTREDIHLLSSMEPSESHVD